MTATDYSSVLASSAEGGSREPPLLVVWGPGGIGKTSFALKHAEKPAVIAFEVGARSIAGTRVYPNAGVVTSWDEATALVGALAHGQHDYKTVVLDSLNPLESLCIAHVVRQSGKASYEKMGWGREVPVVAALRSMLGDLEHLKYRGVQVILTAHEKRKTIKDPVIGEYGAFTASTQLEHTWNAVFEWADIVGFCRDDYVAHEGRVVQASSARTLHTIKGAGFQAKQRYGYEMQSPVALDWRAFSDALRVGGESASIVLSKITAVLIDINDPEVTARAKTYIDEAKNDLYALREVYNALLLKKENK